MDSNSRRITTHPVLGPLPDAKPVNITFDGQPLMARSGEVVAAALMAYADDSSGKAEGAVASRFVYCAIGHCFACQMTIDGRPGVRACLTPVREGMRVQSGTSAPGAALLRGNHS